MMPELPNYLKSYVQTSTRPQSLVSCLPSVIQDVNVPFLLTDVVVSARAELPRGPLLKRGSTITLICNTTVTTTGPVQVQVQWLRWPLPVTKTREGPGPGVTAESPTNTKPTVVATLMYDGVAKIASNGSGGGSEVSVDRLSALSYRLRVHAAAVDDQGLYACHAEAWGQDPHGGWYNTGARAESPRVTVYLYARGTCSRDTRFNPSVSYVFKTSPGFSCICFNDNLIF